MGRIRHGGLASRHLSKQILSIHRRVLGAHPETLSSMAKVAQTGRKLEEKL